ncbi:MAG: citramalate synthase [Halobacteriales archaeon]|nr:citramalate synthase [Halobacteriales archaeon]
MRLCDVTLREAVQLSDREYTVEQRVAAGEALDRLDLPFVQAGFPAIGETEREVTATLADRLYADVVAIARGVESDVSAALETDADVVELFVPVSDRQLEHVVGRSREAMYDTADDRLAQIRDGGAQPHLTLMDGFRTDERAIASAFERFDCPIVVADTVGARTPSYVAGFLRTLADLGVDLSRAGVHFHDDLGCATANALVAAQTGVDRIDVSVASLGERAGNPATEEVVTAIVQEGGDPEVATEALIPVSESILNALGESVDARKPVLGREVTTHESGIHTDAMLTDPATFEPFDPATFGGKRRLVFGAATGRGAARKLLERADREATDERVKRLLDRLATEGPVEIDVALSLAEDI